MTTLYGKEAQREIVCSFNDYGSLGDGEQIRCNHATCEAGTDIKHRFNIKCVDGAYLFHCYHCGVSGYFKPREIIRSMSRHELDKTAKHRVVSKVKDRYLHAEQELDKFCEPSALWLASYGFDDEMVHKYGIRCDVSVSGKYAATLLPIFDEFPLALTGFQQRNHFDGSSKYLTNYYEYRTLAHFNMHTSNVVFFVEDLLSAYKLHHAGANVVCLLGTHPPDVTHKLKFSKSIDHAIVWLDPDFAGKVGSKEVFTQLAVQYRYVNNLTINMTRQPKEVGINELKEIINNVRH